MNRFEEIKKLVSNLAQAEKAQLLQVIANDFEDVFPGIESIADVCGGEPCIVRTRIPVWVLVQAKLLGTTQAELLHCYPTLRVEDLSNAWAYFHSHQEEIELQIRQNEEA